MKKIITIILTLAMICCTMSITAFAANEPYFGYGEMTATAYSYSSFEYSIPESCNFDIGSGNECKISIISYDLDTNYEINVRIGNLTMDGTILMTHQTKEGVTADLEIYKSNGERYTQGDKPIITATHELLDELNIRDYTFTALLSQDAAAGQYSGVIQFNLSADPVQ